MARRGQTALRTISVTDIRRLVVPSDPQIDFAGELIAWTNKTADRPGSSRTELWIAGVNGSRAARRLTKGPRDRSPRWSPDAQSLAFVGETTKGNPQIFLASVARMQLTTPTQLTKLAEGSLAEVRWSPRGDEIAFAFRQTMHDRTHAAAKARESAGQSTPPLVVDDPWYRLDGDGVFGSARFRLFIVTIATRRVRAVDLGDTMGSFTFEWSPDGRSIIAAVNRSARAIFEPWMTQIVVADARTGKSRVIEGLPEGPKSSPSFSPDGSMIAYAGRRGRHDMYATKNLGLFVHDLHTKKTRDLLAATDFCLMSPTLSDCAESGFGGWFRWMPDSESLIMRIGWHGSGFLVSAGARGGVVVPNTSSGADHIPSSLAGNGTRIALIRSTPTEPPEVCVAEINGREFAVRQISRLNTALCDELDLSVPQEAWAKAKDGAWVHYWIMRPPAAARVKGRTPAVIEVHGGPHAQYGWTFFHEFQLLAAAGYTVAYGNPRGSKGYGAESCSAIHGSWGDKDWLDVQAITRAVQRDARVDSKRIGIMGGSYGGYMALWATGHSNVYCGAISDRCVSNIVSHCGNSDFPNVPGVYWKGSAYGDPTALWKSSPIASFSKARTPMLLIHSEGDLRCNIEQSEQIHAALAAQNVPVRFVRYPRETSHGMSRSGPPDLRMHRLGEILAWWKNVFAKK